MSDSITIIYDGECPLCRNYVKFATLKEHISAIDLIDARDAEHRIVSQVIDQGYNLDQGMVVLYADETYYGAEAVHLLALLSSKRRLFNQINHWVLRSKFRAKLLYPLLRLGRRIVLTLKGVKSIHQ